MYGLKVSLDGQVQRPERQGSKFVIKGTFSLWSIWYLGRQKVSPIKKGNFGSLPFKKEGRFVHHLPPFVA